VVAGIRSAQEITEKARRRDRVEKPSMERAMPRRSRVTALRGLEKHYRDMPGLEFTVEQGKRGCCRRARASDRQGGAAHRGRAANESSSPRTRRCAVDPASLDQLLHPTIDPKASAA